MVKYVSKVVEIEAIEWTGKNTEEVQNFCGDRAVFFAGKKGTALSLANPNGNSFVGVGAFIIKEGEDFYPSSPEIFKVRYAPKKEKRNVQKTV